MSDPSLSSEYERYVHSDFVTHLQTTEFETFDVLGFWKAKETTFLILSRMAMDILSVQATSAVSEFAFSTSGRVFSIRRTRLTPASLEMCMCLKDHFDAQERKQDKYTIETSVDLEEEILDAEVQANEAIPLSDKEIALDVASSEGSMSEPGSGGEEAESACSKVFTGDIYGDQVVSCNGIIGIKHRHNVVRDTLVDICFWSWISAGKEVDIGLGGGCDKPLRSADMLLYSWDEGLDVCVELTGSSPLMQIRMVDFVPGHAVIDATHRKRVKYEAKCAGIRYGFLPFSLSSLGELDKDAATLLKRIRKFSVTHDNRARVVVHIFNRINFAIAKGVGAQLVSRLLTNFFLNDLDNATLHIDGQSTEVDVPQDIIINVVDEDDDITDDEDMSADVARSHGGDGGGKDCLPPHHVPSGCMGCFANR
nr:hypothetical protein [Tanacetum cinerariifolium]